MPLRRRLESAVEIADAPRFRALAVERDEWLGLAQSVAAAGGRLLALWATPADDPARAGGEVYAAYRLPEGGVIAGLTLQAPGGNYPSLHDVFPATARMQRAAFDVAGVPSTDGDTRRWLAHTAWPRDLHPLVAGEAARVGTELDAYAFVRVAGDGVHEIPVGPVHAGIIEPGHFRFSVVGEKVLKLEERLGYVHKGIERRFTELRAHEAHRLAARVSGESTVAFSWAYCQALECIAGCAVPARAVWLRALYLELERIANHLGDLGALGNDAGFAFGLAQFSQLKEALLRATASVLGRRYLFDTIVPGGVAAEPAAGGTAALAACAANIAERAAALRAIYDNHSGVRDRFVGAGRVASELAARLGLTGFAGRASGLPFDARIDLPCAPYPELAPARVVASAGDVAARVAVRFDELFESCRLVQKIARELPAGSTRAVLDVPATRGFGVGLVEGWRGPVFVALETGAGGAIRRCHPHDPSWQNWPVLEHAIVDNIVPDFPLINKSFNLSYSGHDL